MRNISCRLVLIILFVLLACIPLAPAQTAPPVTVAERSDFQATSRHADVVDFCEKLAKLSPLVRLKDLGQSSEGRRLPLVIIADPPIETPEDATKSGKLVVLAIGNIHAGEVDGKEAVLMPARDIATGDDKALLKELVILIKPTVVKMESDWSDDIAATRLRIQGMNEPGQGAKPD